VRHFRMLALDHRRHLFDDWCMRGVLHQRVILGIAGAHRVAQELVEHVTNHQPQRQQDQQRANIAADAMLEPFNQVLELLAEPPGQEEQRAPGSKRANRSTLTPCS
jgi:hypothetical protein